MAYSDVIERRKARVHLELQTLLGLSEKPKKPRRKPPPTLEEIVLKHIRRMRKV